MKAFRGTLDAGAAPNQPECVPIVEAQRLDSTLSATSIASSATVGLTLPGMIDEPGATAGKAISRMPPRGPEHISPKSCAVRHKTNATASTYACASTRLCAPPNAAMALTGSSITSPLIASSASLAFSWKARELPSPVPASPKPKADTRQRRFSSAKRFKESSIATA